MRSRATKSKTLVAQSKTLGAKRIGRRGQSPHRTRRRPSQGAEYCAPPFEGGRGLFARRAQPTLDFLLSTFFPFSSSPPCPSPPHFLWTARPLKPLPILPSSNIDWQNSVELTARAVLLNQASVANGTFERRPEQSNYDKLAVEAQAGCSREQQTHGSLRRCDPDSPLCAAPAATPWSGARSAHGQVQSGTVLASAEEQAGG